MSVEIELQPTIKMNDEQFREMLRHLSSELTTGAAIGYMIMAAQALDVPNDLIQDIEYMMREKMDFYSIERAEQVYNHF